MTIQPWFISGFVDGEGSFHVAFVRRQDLPKRWVIIPEFHISQNSVRDSVLYEIKQFFDCGNIHLNHRIRRNDDSLVYVVRNRRDLLNKIIPFFKNYPLRSSKNIDAKIFAEIVYMMADGIHLSNDGFKNIVQKAYQMNGGGRYRKRMMQEIVTLESSETICQVPNYSGKI